LLDTQKKNYFDNNSKMLEINNIAKKFYHQFYSKKEFNLQKLGEFINLSWNIKKMISKKININISNTLINFSIKNGAYGAKVSGAGGGGFVFVLAESKVHRKIDKKFKNILSEEVNVCSQGSSVIYKSY
jgi:D-glycero-alpha-D-manno-heptose-7-phosphate kinase